MSLNELVGKWRCFSQGAYTVMNADEAFDKCADELETALQQQGEAVAWMDDATNYGDALNNAAWVFVDECPEKSALLFNNLKPALRAAIIKYGKQVAPAHPPKPVVSIEEIRGAVARGWCHGKNAHKVMDDDLAEAIALEVTVALGVKS